MAYTNQQRRQHIAELQKYLYAISLFNNKIPSVAPSGVYDNSTSIAVRAFQREYGLPETGNTNSATWNKIVSVYRSFLHSRPAAYNVFPSSSYVAKNGDSGQVIYILQAMLNDIGEKFDNAPRLDICGNYNENTINAVKLFQRRVALPQNGNVDCGTWNMIVHCCEHLNKTML